MSEKGKPVTTYSELLTTGGGVLTSVLVVSLNLGLVGLLRFDFLSLSFWLVIPAGALMGGFGAASGYYLVAKRTQTMSNRRLLFNMVAVGVSTWVLYQWIDYYMLVLDDGTHVRDIATFWQYFTTATEHMQLTIGTRFAPTGITTGDIGKLGYVRESLQLLGFMVGGFATYMYLASSEACQSCRRYTKGHRLLDAAPAKTFDAALQEAGLTLSHVGDDAVTALGKRPFVGLDLTLLESPLCHAKWLRPAVAYKSGNSVDRTRLGLYSITEDAANRIRKAVRA